MNLNRYISVEAFDAVGRVHMGWMVLEEETASGVRRWQWIHGQEGTNVYAIKHHFDCPEGCMFVFEDRPLE